MAKVMAFLALTLFTVSMFGEGQIVLEMRLGAIYFILTAIFMQMSDRADQ